MASIQEAYHAPAPRPILNRFNEPLPAQFVGPARRVDPNGCAGHPVRHATRPHVLVPPYYFRAHLALSHWSSL
jgi:hypothetical protein